MTKSENKKVLLCNSKWFILKLVVSILFKALLLVIPIFYSYGIDSISKGDYNGAYLMIGVYLGSFILYRIFEMVNQWSYYVLYAKVYKTYVNLGLTKTYNNSIYSLSRINSSEYSNIMSEDFEVLSDYYATLVFRFVDLLEFIFIIIYFFVLNLFIGLSSVVLVILVLLLLSLTFKQIQTINETRKLKHDKRIGLFQELFAGVKEIKGFNIFNSIKNRIDENVKDYTTWNNRINVQRYNLRQISLGVVDIFRIGSLFYGVYLITLGQLTLGMTLIIFNYYSKLIDSFTSIITLIEGLTNVKVAKKRVFKLFQYASDKVLVAGKDISSPKGKITFDNVLYGPKDNPILNYISFTVNPNTLTLITGPTGSGKTGIFDLLLKLNRQHTGKILIDDKAIETYGSDIYYNLVSVVQKNPTFFAVSIRENLTMIEPNFEIIIELCKRLDIHEYIMSLPLGYDTLLLTDGSNINSEVRYLLAIVRMILKGSKILLLDETFNFLGQEITKKLLKLFNEMKNNYTIIIITKDQKILACDQVDYLIYLEKGQVVYEGKKDDVKKDRDYIKDLKRL